MIRIEVSKKVFFLFLSTFTILILGLGTLAFGTSDPSTFGHDVGELDLGPITIVGDQVIIGQSNPIQFSKLTTVGNDPIAVTSTVVNEGGGQVANYLVRKSNGVTNSRFGWYIPPGTEDVLRLYHGDGSTAPLEPDINIITYTADGRVGIGTTSPQSTAQLHVVRDTSSKFPVLGLFEFTGDSGIPHFTINNRRGPRMVYQLFGVKTPATTNSPAITSYFNIDYNAATGVASLGGNFKTRIDLNVPRINVDNECFRPRTISGTRVLAAC
tara:strand:+ start:4438 stop:5244 length:807 start_codon:yes stop_codon:yes gene_type:complete